MKRYFSNKRNIYYNLKKINIINTFKSELSGYHLINKEPCKESVWEEINRNIVNKYHITSDHANGNHLSGKDNKFGIWNISNKTSKLNNNIVNLSSYRLSSQCNEKNCGSIGNIKDEIIKRDSSFDYYSLLIRDEKDDNIIKYYWYIIPRDYYLFDVNKYDWSPKIGKNGKKKDCQVGWQSKYMDITFSMSSQLWYHFDIALIEKYLITSIDINKNNYNNITYSDLYHLLVKSNFI